MKAFEARKGSIKPQYDSAIHDIQRAVGWGWKNTHVDIHGSLYPEVATMLAKDGYDVKIVTINNGTTSLYNEVSWENAAEGKEGTVTYEDETFPVAPETSAKVDELLKNVLGIEPEEEEDEEDDDEIIKVAIIGKPNVGKSSLVNKISGVNRAIVSDIAGTTRDTTDTFIENEYGKFNFIDTAGLRRKNRVDDAIEKYSIIRARMAVERANVCVIMIDAVEGFTEQDSKVAGIALDQGKACIIAVNKWDAVEKDGNTMKEYRDKLANDFSFMSYAPIMFISAKTGQRIDKLYEMISFVHSQNSMRISTGKLNEVLAGATARVQPPTDKGKRLKIFYMTQASTRPPTFVFFVNNSELFHFSYQRYLENQIRDIFGLDGTPVRFIIRERGEGNK